MYRQYHALTDKVLCIGSEFSNRREYEINQDSVPREYVPLTDLMLEFDLSESDLLGLLDKLRKLSMIRKNYLYYPEGNKGSVYVHKSVKQFINLSVANKR